MKSESDATRLRRFRPTERDIEMVRYTWEAGLATREQLQQLFFSEKNRSRAQTRLGLLRGHGYLEQLPGRWPNEPAVFVVSGRAARGLRLVQSLDDAKRRPWPVSSARLRHSVAIADCRVRFTLACRQPGHDMVRWLAEEELRPITAALGIVPDAYLQVERTTPQGPRRSGMFLECEISEKSEKALRQKLLNLGMYYYSGEFERAFSSKALRVLVLVKPEAGTSGRRLVSRITRLGAALGVTLLRIAELETFLQLKPEETFYEPIWSQPGVDGLVALFGRGGGPDDHQRAA